MDITNTDLAAVEEFLADLALNRVGPIIRSKSGSQQSYELKTGSRKVDIVTAIDKQVEQIIWSTLKSQYPAFRFVGEESYEKGVTKITDDPTFIVDPIDGTTNFVHDFPFSCTSMGMTLGKEPVVGVVYNPHLNLLVTASRGNGVKVNGKPFDYTAKIKSMRSLQLSKSIVALQPGSAREGPNFKCKTATYENLLAVDGGFVHGFRNLGSTAMTLVYIALGNLDSYWDGGCYSWDVCAGWCILNETGGRIVGANAGEWHIGVANRTYLAVRGTQHPEEQTQYIKDFWSKVKGQLKYD
ncbi:INM1 (YHR046C) [Zygosaccharomyces parabailii]|uniref:Inositol-1-monophosphatase n=1 Tax=Zygosaccharomyces bailii (strain CLIB 213 / ATCC 58445 / CBS 680 / BCRC 21525 / NBRC 1098 / NCYC 1416 / NRRL Y-2227) TaxID=1333698 RepID=A0A8J2T4V3_ZYGB2|nr:INM1 (YHR046C) [Zygosaccharomyces parabailii]CDF89168.1 ZYBA0S03-10792g1_1 [Zygosaccharomyces bailii CLIB 213]CDH16260.1 probable Inositol monophosphatase 1 [Zygosaccharomyces bailii ISA1307]SJM87843.1 probable Inositol monophosphatase 1 [Zygosaccharomyces bailii]